MSMNVSDEMRKRYVEAFPNEAERSMLLLEARVSALEAVLFDDPGKIDVLARLLEERMDTQIYMRKLADGKDS